VVPLNYAGEAGYGASVTANPLGTSGGYAVLTPAAYALGQNFPNPMGSGATAIKYALKAPGRTTLRVYNVLGEEVRTLVDRHQAANYYSVHWDGRDNGGRDVSNGVYFYKLSSGDFSDVRKLTVLK